MRKSKLIYLIKKLKKSEFSQLDKFIHSPFCNSNNLLTDLFDFIKDDYPNFKSEYLTKKNAAAVIFPDLAVTNKRIGNLMSELYQLILEFLGQMEYQTNKVERGKLKAEALRKKGMLQYYQKELDLTEKELHDLPARNLDYYWHLLHIQSKRYGSDLQINHTASKNILENMMISLDRLYALGKLKISSEMLSRQGILEEDYGEKLFLEDIKLAIENDFGRENPLLKMYFYVVQLVKTGEAEYYWKLKDLFFDKHRLIGQENKIDIFVYLMNYAVKSKEMDKEEFQEEAFDLPKLGFETNILNEELSSLENTFQNMIINGARLGRFEWLDSFLKNIEENPKHGYSEDVLIFVKAVVLYEKKEFSKARFLILSHKFKREQDKVRTKSALIRILYEEYLEDDTNYEVLNASILAFKKYLNRNKKLPANRVTSYLKFLNRVKELARYHFKRENNQRIKDKFVKTMTPDEVANHDWLLLKIQDL